MTNEYHAILIDTEFSDPSFIGKWKILGKKKSASNPWYDIRVEVPENRLEEMIKDGQKALLKEKFYFHMYRDNEVIVVFPKKVFYTTPDKPNFKEIVEYGKTINIPEKQLDFHPFRFEDETY